MTTAGTDGDLRQLYAEALAEYLARHDPDEITAAMDRTLDAVDEAPDPAIAEAALRALERDSVANVSSIVTLDRSLLRQRSGRLSARQLGLVLAGIDLVLGH